MVGNSVVDLESRHGGPRFKAMSLHAVHDYMTVLFTSKYFDHFLLVLGFCSNSLIPD